MKKKIVFENNNWLVYTPEDFETAHELYMKAKWCVAHRETYYNYYKEKCIAGYYIINKRDFNKSYGLAIEKNDYELVDVNCYRHYPFNIPGKFLPVGLLGGVDVPTYILKKLFTLNNIKTN